MALDDYKPYFDNAYEETFLKTLVAKASVANMRFEPSLKYGGTVVRPYFDLDGVLVRTVTRGSASTIDTVTDSTETLTVNVEKEAVFYLSDGEVTQTGPLNPGEVLGSQIGQKVSADLDGRIFAEVLNAAQTFDTGDLTTLSSSGTPVTMSSTTVPQLVARMPAKLQRGKNQVLSNMCFVVDSYAAAEIAEYLLGKQFDIVESVFQNGYAGKVSTADVYVSENLTGEVTLTMANGGFVTTISGMALTINGVIFILDSASPTVAGHVSAGNTAAQTMTNLAIALEDPFTSVANTYVTIGNTCAALVAGSVGLDCSEGGASLRIRAKGGGRIVCATSISGSTLGSPFLHCYYGKKGGIDVVVQSLKPVEMRKTSTMRGTNIFSSYLAGIKTYADGAKKFLDVQLKAY